MGRNGTADALSSEAVAHGSGLFVLAVEDDDCAVDEVTPFSVDPSNHTDVTFDDLHALVIGEPLIRLLLEFPELIRRASCEDFDLFHRSYLRSVSAAPLPLNDLL